MRNLLIESVQEFQIHSVYSVRFNAMNLEKQEINIWGYEPVTPLMFYNNLAYIIQYLPQSVGRVAQSV
jgi:hypothetical protein